ncbi:MAG: metallophosphoesterase [Methanomicrobia archaeon]|nr:metallophosphoesterase [Methanomicrobia archaeon]
MKAEEVDEWVKQAFKASAEEFAALITEAKDRLREELGARKGGGLVRIDPHTVTSMVVIGDLHGDLDSLMHILKQQEVLNADRIIFLGDYGDRGDESVAMYYVVLRLKLFAGKGERVVLLRGNHEGPPDMMFRPHELPLFFVKRFGEQGKDLYRALKELWSYLPYAVLVTGRYMMMHGGVPCVITSLDEIARARERHPGTSTFKELLWNDPIEGNGCFESVRGAGMLFGKTTTDAFLSMAGVKTVIRSHYQCEGVAVNHDGKVLTVFSRKGAPYYNKRAAYLFLDESMLREAQDANELAQRAARVW